MVRKKKSENGYPLESLRLDYTDLTQDEFVVKCGLPRATYQRWIRQNITPKLTPHQIVQICLVCNISFQTFFLRLGIDISQIPNEIKEVSNKSSKKIVSK